MYLKKRHVEQGKEREGGADGAEGAHLGHVITYDSPTQPRVSTVPGRKASYALHSRNLHCQGGEPPGTGKWALL